MASLAIPLPTRPSGFKTPILLAELFAHLLTLSLGPFSNNSFQRNNPPPSKPLPAAGRPCCCPGEAGSLWNCR